MLSRILTNLSLLTRRLSPQTQTLLFVFSAVAVALLIAALAGWALEACHKERFDREIRKTERQSNSAMTNADAAADDAQNSNTAARETESEITATEEKLNESRQNTNRTLANVNRIRVRNRDDRHRNRASASNVAAKLDGLYPDK